MSSSGTEGDGLLTILLAAVAAATLAGLLIRGKTKLGDRWAPPIAGVLVSIIAIYDFNEVGNRSVEIFERTAYASLGWGLVLTLVGGVTLAVSGGLVFTAAK
ncbi:hypothetical protein [Rhodococcus sp. HNM0569]|uniref:hypothetical protein n=1 Tax=Rhodococcus sp. HNM0569 TaxID=2716340 RepID=UPI00146B73F3|nr:hypothetical protein [Rhodococcus sp. HNM0569]NLU83625.1 hypothetical protein [Rhodococcus sp. HNM0569]